MQDITSFTFTQKSASVLMENGSQANCNTSIGMLKLWNLSVKLSVNFVMKSVMTGVMFAPGDVVINAQSFGKCSSFVVIRSVLKIVSFVLKAQSLSTKSAIDFWTLEHFELRPYSSQFKVF